MDYFDFDKSDYKKYLRSERWLAIRDKALKNANYRCQKCGSNQNLQCHHKHYANLFHESLKDIVVLCQRCHYKEHHFDINDINRAIELAQKNRKKESIFKKLRKELSFFFSIEGIPALYFFLSFVAVLFILLFSIV